MARQKKIVAKVSSPRCPPSRNNVSRSPVKANSG